MVYTHLAFLVLLVGTELFFFYLDYRNLDHGAAKAREKSDWLEEVFGVEDVGKMLDYNLLKTAFGRLKSGLSLVVTLLVLYSGLLTTAVNFLDKIHFPALWGLPFRGTTFFVSLSVLGLIYGLPFSAFGTFVIEEIFDFNTSTVSTWAKDQVKSLLVTVIFTTILAGAVLYFVELFPTYWWLAGWALFVLFGLLMQIIYPRLIAPLFNDFDPVEEGELREAVEEVFDRAGFECSQIYTMDASRRSSHSNAYFVGFGKTKRVVLFDTLLDQMELPQVRAVLAHELAHWKRGHIWKKLVLGAVVKFLGFLGLFYLVNSDWLYGMFNLPHEAVFAGFVVAGLWLGALKKWANPLVNSFSIADEKEADRFAREVLDSPEPMVEALCRLGSENLANPFPDPLYEAFHYSHPPIPERIELLKEDENSNSEEAH